MFELILHKSRSAVYDIDLYTEDGSTGMFLDTGDTVRVILYRRVSSTPVLNLLSGAAATANGSIVTVTSTVPTPDGTVPRIRLSIGQGDLSTVIASAPLTVEINTRDANGVVTNALLGPVMGIAHVLDSSSAAP